MLFEFPLAPGARKEAALVESRFKLNLEHTRQLGVVKGHRLTISLGGGQN